MVNIFPWRHVLKVAEDIHLRGWGKFFFLSSACPSPFLIALGKLLKPAQNKSYRMPIRFQFKPP